MIYNDIMIRINNIHTKDVYESEKIRLIKIRKNTAIYRPK